MTLGRELDKNLVAADDPKEVEVEHEGARATVDVAEAGKLGVRVRGVTVRRARAGSVDDIARELPERLQTLREPIEPVEVDRGLGGAVLRTRPDAMDDDEFFEVGLDGGRDIAIRRYRARRGDTRQSVDWTMTRDDLRRLVDEMNGGDGTD